MMTILPLALSAQHLLIVVALALLLFGGKKIPELMRGMGRGVKEFKDAMNTDYSAENSQEKKSETKKEE